MVKTYLLMFSGAFLIAIILTPYVITVAWRLKLLDKTGIRKIHVREIPRLGGIAFFLAMMLTVLPFLIYDYYRRPALLSYHKQVLVLLLGGGLIFAVGLIDDLKQLRARTKFFWQIAATILLGVYGIRISTISLGPDYTWQLGWLSWPLTILWVAGVTNAMNFVDGLDGLAAGIAAITCGVIAFFSLYCGDVTMTILMLSLLGGLCGFLLYNFNPARIFMGDGGSMFLGFILAGASVLCAKKTQTIVGLTLPCLALGVPIFDTFFSILRRILERRGIFSADRGHIHHRLLDLGLNQRHAALTIYLVTFLAAGMGLFMLAARGIGILIIFACVLVQLVLVFRWVGAIRLRRTLQQLKANIRFVISEREDKQEYDQAVLLMKQNQTFGLWWEGLCTAAKSLSMVYVSLKLENRDGTERTLIWRNSDLEPEFTELIELSAPVRQRRSGPPLRIDFAILVKDSLEGAGHRAALFTRLLGEYSIARLPRPHHYRQPSPTEMEIPANQIMNPEF